uniref:Secreted protein n=1 Tax=Phakopsora pachyrhizi TaxID=170000 RepID=A0A0S1MJJ8_PHAPC
MQFTTLLTFVALCSGTYSLPTQAAKENYSPASEGYGGSGNSGYGSTDYGHSSYGKSVSALVLA